MAEIALDLDDIAERVTYLEAFDRISWDGKTVAPVE